MFEHLLELLRWLSHRTPVQTVWRGYRREKAGHSDLPGVSLASTENGHTGVGRFVLFKSESEPTTWVGFHVYQITGSVTEKNIFVKLELIARNTVNSGKELRVGGSRRRAC